MKTILNCTESPKEARTSKNKTSKQPKTKKEKNNQLGDSIQGVKYKGSVLFHLHKWPKYTLKHFLNIFLHNYTFIFI